MIISNKKLRTIRRKQGGVGLIEVLVALVVVSFGVLGMASLQLTGMKHSSGSFNRSKAMLFAQSMATRIRLNPVGVAALEYEDYTSKPADCKAVPTTYCQARIGVTNTPSCNATELAAFDLFSVACGDVGTSGADTGVIGTLPNGQLIVKCVDVDCKADSAYEITVTWNEGRARSATDERIARRVNVRLRP